MHLHIGGEYTIKKKDIVGIFDIENSTISLITKEYLKDKEKKGKIISISDDLPKSFIVVKNTDRFNIYLTSISSTTLKKRLEENRHFNGGLE